MADRNPGNVILIGYRGSGKSTVGRLLAEQLGWTFVDTDALIESQAGSTIADVFATEGEAGFRAREGEAIVQITQDIRQVIAVGGGAVTDRRNVERLRGAGKVIWLTAPPEVLWQRISRDERSGTTRPDLTPAGGLDEVRAVLAGRQDIYRAAASLTFNTEHHEPPALVSAIFAALQTGPGP